jgi:dihydroxy-acid dehydratase
VRDGDIIQIDIPNRTIHLDVNDEQLADRRQFQNEMGWKPEMQRPRKVSAALRAYGLMVTSADKGAVRDLSGLG